ncbi:MAG: deoxyribonuclease IV [Anaerolineaceae bacterium 4572_78]|nr:MAG: deoxyribonuclease IV [Anaerolineaceae bacterium 4572_78]
MPKLGVHVSIAGGIDKALDRAEELNCNTMQIFTKNNNRWKARELRPAEIERYHERQAETGIEPVVTHASYLINLGSPKYKLWEKSMAALVIELRRCEILKIPYLVLHPGAHVKSGREAGLKRVAEGLDMVHNATSGYQVKIALELTAGQGTVLGYQFDELSTIISKCQQHERLVVCFDTCHAIAAGYEFRNESAYQAMIDKFDTVIGLDKLVVIHLNDSIGDLGSRLDRHAHIGMGKIGLEPFGFFLNDSRFTDIPFLLETPQDVKIESDRENLARLRSLIDGVEDDA